jgi:hypothetical protein
LEYWSERQKRWKKRSKNEEQKQPRKMNAKLNEKTNHPPHPKTHPPALARSSRKTQPQSSPFDTGPEIAGGGVVAGAWSTFVKVGRYLAHIRDHRLYRAEFRSFEEYCRARWHSTPRHVNRLVQVAELVNGPRAMHSRPLRSSTPQHPAKTN